MKILKIIVSIFLIINFSQTAFSKELNIYSHRQPYLLKPFLDAYTKKTKIKLNVVYASKGLAQRLASEGKNTPADLILTVDIGRLYIYKDKNLLAKIQSNILNKNIPKHLRSDDGTWFGLSKRSRVIAVSKSSVKKGSIKRYEDLSKPIWKGKVCSRPGSHVYNRALMASLIAEHGYDKALKWAKGFVKNLAKRPQGNDRSQIMAVAYGEADVAIANTYYYGLMLSGTAGTDQLNAAKKVKMLFPNQDNRGTHVNISGAGILKYSKNSKSAEIFLEFLLSTDVQKHIVNNTFEYPMIAGISPHPLVVNMGLDFKQDLKTKVVNYGKRQADALEVMTAAGWK